MAIITADVQKMTAVRRHYLKIGHSDIRILPIVIEIIDETTDTDGWFDFQEFIKLISINSKLLLNFQTTESISNDGECQDENYNGDDGDNSKSGTTKSATKIVGKNFSFLYSLQEHLKKSNSNNNYNNNYVVGKICQKNNHSISIYNILNFTLYCTVYKNSINKRSSENGNDNKNNTNKNVK